MILLCYGTRPELIKVFPIALELKRQNIPYQTLFTGQHKHLIKEYKYLIDKPTYTFHIFKKNQSLDQIYAKILTSCDRLFKKCKHTFKWILIQGDTTSATAIAHSAFHHKIKIAHIEAGLRSFHKDSPFPEEINRTIISHIADIHFTPSLIAHKDLLKENIDEDTLYLVGNTIADSISYFSLSPKYTNKIVITLHRRENIGPNMFYILKQINTLAKKYPDLEFIYILHPNRQINEIKNILQPKPNIKLLFPLEYVSMLELLAMAKFIITDSGGIQEEAMCLGKKCIICRNTTERPEVVHYGYGFIVGTNITDIFNYLLNHYVIEPTSFYGENVAKKIVNVLVMKLYHETEC
tara:strand:- start:590 stop:1642 length:1053 start_codon:yes stop_codon:yes gene_type:complete